MRFDSCIYGCMHGMQPLSAASNEQSWIDAQVRADARPTRPISGGGPQLPLQHQMTMSSHYRPADVENTSVAIDSQARGGWTLGKCFAELVCIDVTVIQFTHCFVGLRSDKRWRIVTVGVATRQCEHSTTILIRFCPSILKPVERHAKSDIGD